MHDIRMIRETPDVFDTGLARRGLSGMSSEILALDTTWRGSTTAVESIQAEIKAASGKIGAAMKQGLKDEAEAMKAEVQALKDKMAAEEEAQRTTRAELDHLLMGIPNLPLDDVPEGSDEADNIEIRQWGELPAFDFAPKEHFTIAGAEPLLDFETAAKLCGSRFVVLRGTIAKLNRALVQFMLDTHVANGREEVWAPFLVREEVMVGTGQLPKFAEDSYVTTDGHWLVPTNEVTLTNTVREQILDDTALPIRLTGHAHCFRSEAGSAGRDTTGMLRQHQFEKVEMVSITRPEDSLAELDSMTRSAEGILEALGLPYRTVVLCTGDMGFGARKTHDIEVWLPGQDAYREISSCSVCGDFQARRMNARFRRTGEKRPEFVHTLNGSGLAVGRCLIAVLENGQDADGGVEIPDVLQPYMAGHRRIEPDGTLA